MTDASVRPVCVITGGSSGIGLATALQFVADGYDIAVCGRDEQRLAAARSMLKHGGASRVLAEAVDLSVSGSGTAFIERCREHFGRVDVLVNNAGAAPCAPLEEITPDQFTQAIAVNVTAAYETVRAVWPVMRAGRSGVVVNVSSLAAVDPFPGFSVYGGCKAWVEVFTRAMAAEGKPLGIRVFAVRPGAVETPLLRRLFPDFPADQTLGPDSVARVIHHLCDPAMVHSTGEAIVIKQ